MLMENFLLHPAWVTLYLLFPDSCDMSKNAIKINFTSVFLNANHIYNFEVYLGRNYIRHLCTKS